MKERSSDILDLLLFLFPLFVVEFGLIYYGIVWQFQHFVGQSQSILILVVLVLCIMVGFVLLILLDCLIDTVQSDGYVELE